MAAANATSSLSLSFNLYIPRLSFNLLSISRLTKSLNCSVTSFFDHCVFQEFGTQKMTDTGRESGGLYHLKRGSTVVTCSRSIPYLDIYYRLGHPSFKNSKILVFVSGHVFIRL